jgi:alkylated DNA repair dioxygenase AlkB
MLEVRVRYALTMQANLFGDSTTNRAPNMPAGFLYVPSFLPAGEETRLVSQIAVLPLKPFEFHGYLANRRVINFGFRYDYSRRELNPGPEMPPFILELRAKIAGFAGRNPAQFRQVQISEYSPGAGIGWHRDKPQFGEVVGVSLLTTATLRLRQRLGPGWQRVSKLIEPRSLYVLGGDVRQLWEHSIPAVTALRYALTFRTLSDEFAQLMR